MKSCSLKVQWLVPVLLSVLLLATGCSSQEQQLNDGELVIPGTGACEDLLRKLASAFNATAPGFKVVIPASTGSGGGIQAVGEKQVLLGRVARPFKEKEEHYGLARIPFAKDAAIFAVGAWAPQLEMSTDELARIFSGQTVSWQLEDGSRQPIRVIARQEGDSALQLIRSKLAPFAELKFGSEAKVVHHDYEMSELLNKYGYAIGFLSRSSLLAPDRRFRAVELAGQPLTEARIRSAAYPLLFEYALIYRVGKLSDKPANLSPLFVQHRAVQLSRPGEWFPLENNL
jgi:phosphate transport system substrate-binding protein